MGLGAGSPTVTSRYALSSLSGGLPDQVPPVTRQLILLFRGATS
jgi:hypothetical protein